MQAVLFDALGTLVFLKPPVPVLRGALAKRGVDVSEDAAARAMRSEIGYYRAHHDMAGTRAGLDEVRDGCASVVEHELQTGLPIGDVREALLEAIRFEAFPEVRGVLEALHARGTALAVVSNWDLSLHDVLEELDLMRFFAVVVTSAEVGVAKPDPRPFAVALEALGVAPRDALHVGDDPIADVEGAAVAGCAALLVRRGSAPAGGVIGGLEALLSATA